MYILFNYYEDEKQNIRYEAFRKHGALHNIFGPAWLEYDLDGTVLQSEYWLENEILCEEDWEEKTYIERNRILMLEEI